MPDWSYQTLFRPALFRLPAPLARDITLSLMGSLAAFPLGEGLIELMGHMDPPADLTRQAFGLTFPSPVGLGAGLDPGARATRALQRFGLGFLELGPVTEAPVDETPPPQRLPEREAIWYPDLPANPGLGALLRRLKGLQRPAVPLGLRLAHRPGASPAEAAAEQRRLMERLTPHAAFWVIDTREAVTWSGSDWAAQIAALVQESDRPLLLSLAPDLPPEAVARLLEPALAAGIAGLVIDGAVAAPGGGRLEGAPAREATLAMLRHLRQERRLGLPIIAGGGLIEPANALRLLDAGATLLQVHAGLVYSGPGLPKRINEAITWHRSEVTPSTGQTGWIWAVLLGWGMLIGGLLAILVAVTRVVLPYDEAFVGLTRAQLGAINPRLLPFMAHDRISLAGTMAAIGLLYLYLGWYPLRRGERWARSALLISGIAGFGNFFLFLGYGYFDPLHALVSLLLLPFYILALIRSRGADTPPASPNLRNDPSWRMAQWGQLLLVAMGAAILTAGATIASIGISHVFVHQDLTFLQTTADALRAANPRLVPLIAHDRAGFGGALVCNGLTVLLLALWGYRQGARWLWWAMGLSGFAAYAAALWTHLAVGYVDQIHLLPVYVGVGVLGLALALSYRYLCTPLTKPSPAA